MLACLFLIYDFYKNYQQKLQQDWNAKKALAY
jgi:hypothetical protein